MHRAGDRGRGLKQIKAHLNDTGIVVTDRMLHSWMLDPAIINPGTPGIVNDEPLFIRTRAPGPVGRRR